MDVASLEYGSKRYAWGNCAAAFFLFSLNQFLFFMCERGPQEQHLFQHIKSPAVSPDRQLQLGILEWLPSCKRDAELGMGTGRDPGVRQGSIQVLN